MIININDLKQESEDKLQKKLADVLQSCKDLDALSYANAKAQIECIEEAIDAHNGEADLTILFVVDKEYYPIHLDHTDVLNEIFCAMEEIKKLSK